MGIPRLTWLFRPYAEIESLDAPVMVLDGPAFCYHIYFICLSSRKFARNALEACVSYKELGQVAVAWLDCLTASGVQL
jgi:hypothetical protein